MSNNFTFIISPPPLEKLKNKIKIIPNPKLMTNLNICCVSSEKLDLLGLITLLKLFLAESLLSWFLVPSCCILLYFEGSVRVCHVLRHASCLTFTCWLSYFEPHVFMVLQVFVLICFWICFDIFDSQPGFDFGPPLNLISLENCKYKTSGDVKILVKLPLAVI